MDSSSPLPPAQPLVEQLKRSPVSVALIVVNVVVFAIAERHGSTRDTDTLLRYGAAWRGLVWTGEWWRLITPMFLHIGPVHLAWNAWFGFRMCSDLERDIGGRKFLALYVASGICGASLSVIGHDAVSAGASGALFGLIGARFLRWRLAAGSWRAVWNDERLRRDLVWTGMWFVLGAYAGFDNWAHLGGLLFGLAGMWAVIGWPRRVPLVLACVLLVGLVAAALRPLPVIHARDRKLFAAYDARKAEQWQRVLDETEGLTLDDWVLGARLDALLALERWQEALPLALVRTGKNDLAGWRQAAWVRLKAGQREQALSDLDKALSISATDAWSLQERAQLHRVLGRLPEARRDAEALIRQGDTDEARALLAEIASAEAAALEPLGPTPDAGR